MRILIGFFIIYLFAACKNTTKEEHNIQLNGNWVLIEFLENLDQSKSLKMARELSDVYCTEIIIDDKKDSLIVYNGQEAYTIFPLVRSELGLKLPFQNKRTSEIIFDPKDSTLFFADSVLNRVFRYQRVGEDNLDTSLEIPLAMTGFINEKTVAGSWSDDYGNKLSLGVYGDVVNWELYDRYLVFYNPSVLSSKDGDMLMLSKGDSIDHLYGMQRLAEELVLYDLKPTEESSEYTFGAVKFRFKQE